LSMTSTMVRQFNVQSSRFTAQSLAAAHVEVGRSIERHQL
jgi:hypothetical protein